MKLNTDQFGEIEIEEHRAVTFNSGIPGFEHLQKFVFLQPDLEIPFSFMQSIEDPSISLIVTNPFHFYPDYVCELPILYINDLLISNEEEAMIWSVVTIQGTLEQATINLLAPIIVNSNQKLGKQIILHETQYQTKHTLFTEHSEFTDIAPEQE